MRFLEELAASRIGHRKLDLHRFRLARQQGDFPQHGQGSQEVLFGAVAELAAEAEAQLGMPSFGYETEVASPMDQLEPRAGQRAGLLQALGSENGRPPSTEIGEPKAVADMGAEEFLARQRRSLIAEHEADLPRDPAIAAQQRGGRDSGAAEDFQWRNSKAPQPTGDVQQGQRVMGVIVTGQNAAPNRWRQMARLGDARDYNVRGEKRPPNREGDVEGMAVTDKAIFLFGNQTGGVSSEGSSFALFGHCAPKP